MIHKNYPRVKNNYQVHLWDRPAQKHGVLFCSDNGIEESISYAIATALRLMTGQTNISDVVDRMANTIGLKHRDAEYAIEEIITQFLNEGVVEVSVSPLFNRNFSLPLKSQYQLKIIQLQLTNKCNLSCVHCYAESGSPLPCEMSTTTIFKLIDEFVDLGGCRLFLTGGETLVYKNLDDVISYAKSRHLFVYLSTNGFSITEERVDQLIKLGVGAVNVSIDGDNDETHDSFRGKKNSFKKAINALGLFTKKGINCGSQTTLFKGNLTQSVNIFNTMHSLGVHSCFFVRMMPQGRGNENIELIPTLEEYYVERENEYLNRRLQYGMNVYPKQKREGVTGKRCSAGINQMYVRADGCCYPCPSLEIKELYLGSFQVESLSEIWNSRKPEINELRCFEPKNMSECNGCEHHIVCKGGCAGNAYHITGNWRNPDPHFCITMDIRKKVQQLDPNS
jgi:radical SAM protein with 4Fe4S-binding SPASM domain